MDNLVVYHQINKDHAYWIEKRAKKGGNTAGILTHFYKEKVVENILFDAGFGTLEGLQDLALFSWEWPLKVFITHGHIDHHAELMLLAEMLCTRYKTAPSLEVYCTKETLEELWNVHRYRFEKGLLVPKILCPGQSVHCGIFTIFPIQVDHFKGAVIFLVRFQQHSLIIGWDLKTLPFEYISILKNPSLALFDANTWSPLSTVTGHTSIEELVPFIKQLEPKIDLENQLFGVYLVHYSGKEDPWGPLTEEELCYYLWKKYPELMYIVKTAKRGQQWRFTF